MTIHASFMLAALLTAVPADVQNQGNTGEIEEIFSWARPDAPGCAVMASERTARDARALARWTAALRLLQQTAPPCVRQWPAARRGAAAARRSARSTEALVR